MNNTQGEDPRDALWRYTIYDHLVLWVEAGSSLDLDQSALGRYDFTGFHYNLFHCGQQSIKKTKESYSLGLFRIRV